MRDLASWPNARPEIVAEYMATYMKPLLSDLFKETSAIHFKSILRLCEDAYKLALLLRKSSSDYRYETVPNGTVFDDSLESKISSQAFDSPQKSQASMIQGFRIAFTIFGALVKYEPATGERYVLEKSHVVCRGECVL